MESKHCIDGIIAALKKSARPGKQAAERKGYHHGDLRAALIHAAEDLLVENGVEGFSLREVARRAGVSAGAPAHHFNSAAGLLTEIAISGFDMLAADLQQAASALEGSAAERLRAQGIAYVRFALKQPGRFQVMFRHDLQLPDDVRLHAAGKAALAELQETVRLYEAAHGRVVGDADIMRLCLAVWSMVHGFAHLTLDGKFATLAQGGTIDSFVARELPAIIEATWP